MTEQARLKALEEFSILDTEPEKDFQDLVELASEICETPVSLVSLVDGNRQWFKASKGLNTKETEREYAFCHYAIQNPNEVMVVPDSLLDSRFNKNPLVTGDPNIRFYAGAPLVTKEGYALGTLCIIDFEPREFSEKEAKILKILSKRAMHLIELRKENIVQREMLSQAEENLKLLLDRFIDAQHCARIGSWDWNVESNEIYWSPEMYNVFGINTKTCSNSLLNTWQEKIHPEDLELVKMTLSNGLKMNESNSIEYRIFGNNDDIIWVETRGAVKTNSAGETIRMTGTVQDITNRKKAEKDRYFYSRTLEGMMFDFSHKIRQPLTNCMGIIQVINFENISLDKAREFANYLKISAASFDILVREMSDFVYDHKSKISS